MKQIQCIFIKLVLFTLMFHQNLFAQCTTNYTGGNPSHTNTGTNQFEWAQSFIAECDGALDYVQFFALSPGSTPAGTLNIYFGNTTAGTPIYTQAHPIITAASAHAPLRVDLDNPLVVSQGFTYTFELTITNVSLLYDGSAGYTQGYAFQNDSIVTTADFYFEAGISQASLGLHDLERPESMSIYPNPAFDRLQIKHLTAHKPYQIYNAAGQRLLTGTTNSNSSIDIKALKTGLYLLQLEDGTTLKFIKR